MKNLLLVDMDNTIAEWDEHLRWHLEQKQIKWRIPNSWDVYKRGYSLVELTVIQDIIGSHGFYYSLPPTAGAIETLHELHRRGTSIMFCTTPPQSHPNPKEEKCQWLRRYYGSGWEDYVIFSHDKTLVEGNILIDDKPFILGKNTFPAWRHVLYDRPYNKSLINFRLHEWTLDSIERYMKVISWYK